MDITTSMGLLKFALLGIDLLAWPVLALGYPLFASIRAVETGSKHQMRKLVIYWTLFSLFSLLEFAFAKIIEWIPFWFSIRLVVIFWLVTPQFEGACLAYQALVRPVLLMELQAVIDRFYMLKEDRLCKRETFLDVAEKYIKENGSEALEKLIALEKQHESLKCIDFQRNTKIIEPEGENTAATSDQVHYEQSISSAQVLNGTYAVTNVKEMTLPEASVENRRPETPPQKKTQQEWTCDLCSVTTVGEAMLNAHLQGSKHKSELDSLKASLLGAKDTGPSLSVCYEQSASLAWVRNGTYVITNVKETTPPEASAENRRPETPPLTKNQEWTCDLCNVTTMSKSMLNAHLQGSKHKSKLESLKASLLDAKDTGPSPSVQHAQSAAEVKEIMPPKETAEKRRPDTPLLKKAQQEWTCDLCKVTTTGETTFNDHLHGCTQKSKLETALKVSKLARSELVAEGPSSSATSKSNHGNVAEKLIKESESELEKLIVNKTGRGKCSDSHIDVQVVESEETNGSAASQQVQSIEVKEMTPPEASCAETLSLKETQQEWSRDLCNLKTTSEIMLNAHLQGSKHKSKLESLKASLLDAKDTGPSPSVQHAQSAAEVKEIMPPKETAEKRHPETPLLKKAQQEWTCDLCKVTTTGETTFNDHLHGCTQKSKLETALKVSKLTGSELVAEGPSSSATSKSNNGNVAEKLIKESGSEMEQLIVNKTGRGECSDTHIDVQVVESEEKNGSAALQQVQSIEVKEMTPPEASRAEALPLKKTQKEWSCDLCNVKTTSEITLNAHLRGSKHKSKLESLKASLLDAKDTGPLPSVQHAQSAVEVKEIMPPKETAEKRYPETPLLKKAQQEWTCDLCKVTTTGETTFNDHLHGCTQKSKLETALKVSNLAGSELVAEGPSSSATSKSNNGNVAEKLIKESGSELEQLIVNKTGRGECSDSHIDVQVVESEEKNGSAALQQAQSIEVKEMTPPEASRAETLPLKKTQKEWSCDLCNVKTTSEITLNAHLRGSKHKSKLESLKSSLLDAKDTGPSPSVQHAQSAVEVKEIMPPKETAEKRHPETPLLKKAQQEWTCALCMVTTTNEITFNGHLHGRKHKSKLETALKASKLAGSELVAEGPSSSATSKLNHGNVAEKLIKESGSELEKLIASQSERRECSNSQVVESEEKNGSAASQQAQSVEVKEMKPAEASRAETLPLEKAHQEWSYDLCNVKATSEITPNAHLQGSKHKSKLLYLKTKACDAKDTGRSLETCKANQGSLVGTEIKNGEYKHLCIICDLKLLSDVDAASHFKGKRHSSNIEKMEKNVPIVSV